MTIWERIAAALATLGIPYAADADRSVLGDPLPDRFIVYSLVAAVPELHADDAETERFYRVQLNLYDRAGLTALPDTDTAMLGQGFRLTQEVSIPFNPETGHYGLVREYTILVDQT